MNFGSLFKRKNKASKTGVDQLEGDFLYLLRKNKEQFAQYEYEINNKPIEEVLHDINLGLDLIDSGISKEYETFQNTSILIIPPKYEFWSYLLFTIALSQGGYKTKFLYHNWSNSLVKIVQKSLYNYLQYQNFSFENSEDYDLVSEDSNMIFNFSDSIKGVKNNIPSFSTVLVNENADLDYVLAHIFATTFTFAGLKQSTIKRVIVSDKIKEVFTYKLQKRLTSVDQASEAKIRSLELRQKIHELVSDGISDGADLVLGSGDYDTDNYSNVVLENVPKEARIYQKKYYGPILLISYVDFSKREDLSQYIIQQPSRGIIVFNGMSGDANLRTEKLGNGHVFVSRPISFENEYFELIEMNPTIEFALKQLKQEA